MTHAKWMEARTNKNQYKYKYKQALVIDTRFRSYAWRWYMRFDSL